MAEADASSASSGPTHQYLSQLRAAAGQPSAPASGRDDAGSITDAAKVACASAAARRSASGVVHLR